jgi:hypothetical protein
VGITTDPDVSAAEYTRGRMVIEERQMSKQRETASERIWKEKLDLCLSSSEAAVLLLFAAAVVSVMWMIA